MPDHDFDAFLTRHLGATALPDAGFTDAVVAGIGRRRQRRQWAFTSAAVVAGIATAIAIQLIPLHATPPLSMGPGNVIAGLLLLALCGLAWLGTEAGSLVCVRKRH